MSKPHPRAEELRRLAIIVASIDAQQLAHPGWLVSVREAIIGVELRRLEQETLASEQAQMKRHIDKLEGWVKGLEGAE